MDNGGPAFPWTHFALADGEHGMTLRDYFAAQALRGFITDGMRTPTYESVAQSCYDLADAMLKAREVKL